jgi:hypothetical protein
MSYPILSSSVKWKVESYKKTPNFNSEKQGNAAGRGVSAVSFKPYCTWDFDIEMPTSSGSIASVSSQVSELIGVHAACNGQGGLFLYSDYTDNAVTTGISGMLDVTPSSATPMATTGNGVSTQFQLARSLGGVAWDIIQNLNGSALVYVNGTLTTVSTSSTGVVTYSSAPSSGATLGWAGNFYFLCRWAENSFTGLSMVGYNQTGPLWTCESCKFSSEFV